MKKHLSLKKTAFVLSFGLTGLMAFAQAPAIQWDKTFGGNSYDELYSIVQTSDGGYILAGWSDSGLSGDKTQPSKGGEDYWIVKLDAGGNKQWDKTYGGNDDDRLHRLIQTSDGGYLAGGRSIFAVSGDKTQPSNGMDDYWVIKLNAAGNILWDKRFGGSSSDYLSTFAQTSDGGYILGGLSSSGISGDKTQPSNGLEDYWVVKLDAAGNKLWDKTYGGNSSDEVSRILQTPDGGYLLAGASSSGVSGNKTSLNKGLYDYWVLKLDSNGNKVWENTFGGSSQEIPWDISYTSSGNFILGGPSNSGITGDKTESNRGSFDYWIVMIDAAGNKLWDKTIGGSAIDILSCIVQTPDGGYILGGHSESAISGDKISANKGFNDFWLVKLDAAGNKTWEKTIGGNNFDSLYDLKQTSDGYILGGYSRSGISGDKTQPSKGQIDYWCVKLGPDLTTGINESVTTLNLSISPNPSRGKFQLQLNNLTAKTAQIIISDLVSRVVYRQHFPVTEKQINQEINLPHVKGMYLLQVKTGEQITTRKIVIE